LKNFSAIVDGCDLITGIGGKGGGRPNLAQGSLPDGQVKDALEKLTKVVAEKLK
jgi:alanyl-tRNA synthetase